MSAVGEITAISVFKFGCPIDCLLLLDTNRADRHKRMSRLASDPDCALVNPISPYRSRRWAALANVSYAHCIT